MIEELYSFYLNYPKICTDTRNVEKGSIFFALKGEHFNGNRFASEALKSGCAYVVVDESQSCKDEKIILVNDALATLQELAAHHRKQFNIPVIGITGSNGKTTTRELMAAVLSKKYSVSATKGNLNNHIGVPLSVLSITGKTEIAIIEMGANHPGEIAALCKIAQPTHGIITNIGKAHLEGFGSIKGVKNAKKELYDHISAQQGKIFLNADDKTLNEIVPDVEQITYGSSQKATCLSGRQDCMAEIIPAAPFLSVNWKTGDSEIIIDTQLIGNYNFTNLLAAICTGSYFGVSKMDIKQALENYTPANNRSQLVKKGSNTLILDCYNANPASMTEAINSFSGMDIKNKIVILGDMLELGTYSAKEHQAIVGLLQEKGFNEVFLVGNEFSKTKKPQAFRCFKNTSTLMEFLRTSKLHFQSAHILIKGSRGIKLEEVVEVI